MPAHQRPTPPVRRHNQLSDEAADYMRELILIGGVRGGEYLRVERIASEMGISVTPVREALASLRGEGFVTQEPRRGFVVVPLRLRDMRDVLEQQARLAGELAARAVESMSPTKISELYAMQERMESLATGGDHQGASRLNHEFHRRINKASDSRKLAWVLRTVVRFSPNKLFAEIEAWDPASSEDHRTILRALEEGNAELARCTTVDHIGAASQLLLEHLLERGILMDDGAGA